MPRTGTRRGFWGWPFTSEWGFRSWWACMALRWWEDSVIVLWEDGTPAAWG